jgi:hypothetical protein
MDKSFRLTLLVGGSFTKIMHKSDFFPGSDHTEACRQKKRLFLHISTFFGGLGLKCQ